MQKTYFGDEGQYETHFFPTKEKNGKWMLEVKSYSHLFEIEEYGYLVSSILLPLVQKEFSFQFGMQIKNYSTDLIQFACIKGLN